MRYDVIVVGGGPAGLYAAWRLAADGFAVLVCEEHAAIGAPVHCTGVLSADTFETFGLPRHSIRNALTTVTFVSPSGLEVRYTPPTIQAVVIDRGVFDGSLAAAATAAGAEIRTEARVSALACDADRVRATIGPDVIEARLAILASGASYRLQRQLGLGLPRAYLHSAQREVPARTPGDVEIHFGAAMAPGGFAWAVPVSRPSGPHVRIGVMARGQAAGWYRTMLDRVARRWGVDPDGGRPRLKFLPLRSIDRTFADRLLVVGDAAGLVKPTTGGGIHYSVLSASIAAEVARGALAEDRLDAASLRPYQVQWRRRLALRALAQRMSDRQIDALFTLALTDGVMPIVSRTASFNHHRPLIDALLRHAPARRIFWPARG
jgi:geranylgeranyl reductase family protein